MLAALFTLTLFSWGRIIHGTTYFEDAGWRSLVRDIAAIVQYAAQLDTLPMSTTVAQHGADRWNR